MPHCKYLWGLWEVWALSWVNVEHQIQISMPINAKAAAALPVCCRFAVRTFVNAQTHCISEKHWLFMKVSSFTLSPSQEKNA